MNSNYEANAEMYSAGAGIDDKRHLLSITLDDHDILNDIAMSLRGLALVREGDKLNYKRITEPLLNETGVQAVIQNLRSRSDKMIKLGNIDRDEQDRLMRGISASVIEMFAKNSDSFGIDPDRLDDVVDQTLDMIYMNLTRAVGGQERDLSLIQKRIEELYQKSDQHQRISDKRFKLFGRSDE